MSRKGKLWDKLMNPGADATWLADDLRLLLVWKGWTKRNQVGSHEVYTHPEFDRPYVLATHGRKVKSGYPRELRELYSSK